MASISVTCIKTTVIIKVFQYMKFQSINGNNRLKNRNSRRDWCHNKGTSFSIFNEVHMTQYLETCCSSGAACHSQGQLSPHWGKHLREDHTREISQHNRNFVYDLNGMPTSVIGRSVYRQISTKDELNLEG